MSTGSHNLVIVVPVDFSEPSRLAMAWAFDYAQRASCEIHLHHVLEHHLQLADIADSSADQLHQELSEIAEAAKDELAKMAPSAAAREQVGTVTQHIGSGRPATEIVALAEKLQADMIVMGTHGRTGIRRALIGSVAEQVVRHASCTVVCVKPTIEPE